MIPYDPLTHLEIFGFGTTPEAIAMNVAFGFFIVQVYSRMKKTGVAWPVGDARRFAGFVILVLFSALVGGRVWYYAEQWTGPQTLLAMFDLTKGGLISVGMLVGGTVGVILYFYLVAKRSSRLDRVDLARIADVVAPAAALGFFIYRLFGCSIYGVCTRGVETAVPWALFWIGEGVGRHPVTFYLAASALFILVFLKAVFGYEKVKGSRFGKLFDGEPALWFVLLFFFNRFMIEFLRTGKVMYGPLNLVQWVSLVIFISVSVYLVKEYRYYAGKGVRDYNGHRRFSRKSFF